MSTDTTPTAAELHQAALADAQVAETAARAAVIERSRQLAQRLQALVARLERDPDGFVSSAGEVQAMGCHIDTACADLEAHRRHLRVLRTGDPYS